MVRTLILSFILNQGVPVLPGDSGAISGVVRTASGAPAAGVRVAAVTQPDTPQEAALAGAMAGLTQTDESGRYLLENVPPGRYYIAAGRVDQPTYYPGTLSMAEGTAIPLGRGQRVSDVNFVMRELSVRPDASIVQTDALKIPLQVRVEGQGKVPVFAPTGFVIVRLIRTSDGYASDFAMGAAEVTVQRPNGPMSEYRVRVENLPPGYAVRSINAGGVNLQTGTLLVPVASFQTRGASSGGAAASSPASIDVTIAAQRPTQPGGLKVTGRIKDVNGRSIYLSGVPGVLYSDGTFEFQNVARGRHSITTLDYPVSARPFGAAITVGDRDVENVEVEEIPLLPTGARSTAPLIATSVPSLTSGVPALPSLLGRVVDELTGEPFNAGSVTLTGESVAGYKLDDDGRFVIPRLLPGVYNLQVNVYAVGTILRTITIDDADVVLDLSAR